MIYTIPWEVLMSSWTWWNGGAGVAFSRIHTRLTSHFSHWHLAANCAGSAFLKSFRSLPSLSNHSPLGGPVNQWPWAITDLPRWLPWGSPKPGPWVCSTQMAVVGTTGVSISDSVSSFLSSRIQTRDFPPSSMDYHLQRRGSDSDLPRISLPCSRGQKMVPVVCWDRNTTWNPRKHHPGPWFWRIQMPDPQLAPKWWCELDFFFRWEKSERNKNFWNHTVTQNLPYSCWIKIYTDRTQVKRHFYKFFT